ncbi:hypothetical protein AXF42_Ash008312 [Apostasia shenzhenica]|uniref:SAM domain-containing protein n=1 Tax=Apostasia shenzhenica TaxID=1088818 RepID=A0A2I0AXI4_9ASPA|nr:hypothetical protein AXF42_Ash008312 [Apostasia shenzhenica]
MGDLHPPDQPANGGQPPPPVPEAEGIIPCFNSKRQRRPSVRLGEIGDQRAAAGSHDSSRRPKLSKTISKEPGPAKPSTKPRALASTTRRVRTNWSSRFGNGFGAAAATAELKACCEEDARDDEFVEDSESPSGWNDRRTFTRVRVSDAEDEPSEEDGRGWEGDVRSWLEGLGLGRYAPVFEIHGVDDEVLPMLTLEDLKDMGINAVGSRRKMYCAIQKLSNSKHS